MFAVKDKVVFITGGLGLIGKEFANALLRNNAKGVALVDINSEVGDSFLKELENDFGPNKACYINADLFDASQIEGALEKTVKHFGQLDVVINNAAVFNEAECEKFVRVNFVAPAVITNLAINKYFPKYKKTNEAVIINITSLSALFPFECMPLYTSCKSALLLMTLAYGTPTHYEHTGVRHIALCLSIVGKVKNVELVPEYLQESFMMSVNAIGGDSAGESPVRVANAMVEALEKGENGSVWLVIKDMELKQLNYSIILSVVMEEIGFSN